MDSEEIAKIIKSHAGQIFRCRWRRSLKVKSGITHKIEKITETSVRSGIDYNKTSRVKMKREIGELPEIEQSLPWGRWKIFPIIIEHKDSEYVRLFSCYGNVKPKTQYLMDGQETTVEKIKDFVLASEIKPKTDEPLCLTVKLSSLESLTTGKKLYKLK